MLRTIRLLMCIMKTTKYKWLLHCSATSNKILFSRNVSLETAYYKVRQLKNAGLLKFNILPFWVACNVDDDGRTPGRCPLGCTPPGMPSVSCHCHFCHWCVGHCSGKTKRHLEESSSRSTSKKKRKLFHQSKMHVYKWTMCMMYVG